MHGYTVPAPKKPNIQTASASIDQNGQDDSFYKWFIQNYLPDEPGVTKKATPYDHLTNDTGPIYLANSLEEFVPMSGVLRLSEKLADHHTPFVLKALGGSRHAKGYLTEVFEETMHFVDEYLSQIK